VLIEENGKEIHAFKFDHLKKILTGHTIFGKAGLMFSRENELKANLDGATFSYNSCARWRETH